MDPGSALAIASLGITVCQGLFTYYAAWNNYDSDVASDYSAIADLETLFGTLKALLDGRDSKKAIAEQVERRLLDCGDALRRLEKGLPHPPKPGQHRGLRQEMQRLCQPLRSKLPRLRRDVDLIRERLDLAIQFLQTALLLDAQDAQDSHQFDAFIQWLAPTDMSSDGIHDLSRRRRQPGTGQWVVSSEEYQDWLHMERGSLLCTGIPGAGKTTLTSFIIEELAKRTQDDPEIGLAYVFCSLEQQKTEALLGSLLAQLCQTWSHIPHDLRLEYDIHRKRRTRFSYEELSDALRLVVTTYSEVFIVVDALDECSALEDCRANLMEAIFKAQECSKVKILITARVGIVEESSFNVRLQISAREDDIRRYLDGQCHRLKPFVQNNQELKIKIENTIVKSASGMFLLARLHFESIIRQTSAKAVRKVLLELSKAPEQMYELEMQRIRDQGPESKYIATRALLWISCAKRLLTISELRHALAVEIDEPELDEENLTSIEDLSTACVGLVIFDIEPGLVRLVHPTANEFFARTRARWFPESERIVTVACLTYLLSGPLNDELDRIDGELPNKITAYPFYEYAAHFWVDHALKSQNSPDTGPLISRFLASGSRLPSTSLLWLVKRKEHKNCEAAEWLTEQGIDTDLHDAERKTSIHYAVLQGCTKCVELLLKHGADFIGDHNNMTALHYAVQTKREDIVQIILDARSSLIDLPVKRKIWSYAVHHNKHIRFPHDDHPPLAPLEHEGGPGLTPLHYAVLIGSVAMTRLLVERGANRNALSEYLQTPLHLAVKAEVHGPYWAIHYKDHWSDPQYRVGQTPYEEALLDQDPGTGECYIERATRVEQARSDVLDILLNHAKIDFNARDIDDNSLLHCVTSGAEPPPSLLDKLLERDIEVDLPNSKGQTALHLACLEHDEYAIKALLGRGAAVSRTDRTGLNSLHYAALSGSARAMQCVVLTHSREECVRLATAKDHRSRTALHCLLDDPCVDLADVEILTADGISETIINDLDDAGECPMSKYLRGFWFRSAQTAKHLFEAGADPAFVRIPDGLNLGHILASETDEVGLELLKLLAHWGVNLRAEDCNGRTILHHCAMHGSLSDKDVVRFLCDDQGLSRDSRDNLGKTPLELVAEEKPKRRHTLLWRPDRWSKTERALLGEG